MSFHICCTYPLIYRMQLSTPSCPEHLTNHSPHTMEKKHRKGEGTIEGAIVLQTLCLCYAYAMLCYAMLCYAMLCSSNRSRSQNASALRPPRTSDRRSKMNARRPQEIQHERQEAPAGPKLSARRLQEASQNELTQKPSGARELSGAARSRRELSGAVRSQPGEPPGAVRSRLRHLELSGAVGATH